MLPLDKEVAQLAQQPSEHRLMALKRIIPSSTVQAILRQTRSLRHCPRLPKRFMVWFVIGMGLFATDCYRQIFRWLQPFRKKATPGRSTLCEARQRLGVAPFFWLLQRVVKLLATAQTPQAFYRQLRLMAVDGFVLNLPDSPDNARIFGRPKGGRTPGAFPQARILALCEVGTHVLFKCLIKPIRCAEIRMASVLLRHLTSDMLLLWDRGFLSYSNVQDVLSKRAHLLARIKKNLVFQPIEELSDGSYLAKMYPSSYYRKCDRDGILVRIIEYTLNDPARPGSAKPHRLLTSLLDAHQNPAKGLIELYHERWEEELTIDELKTHQQERLVLRSETPAGVVQEIYGLLLAHYVVRTMMFEAAVKQEMPPRRMSFVGALKILRCRLPECPKSMAAAKKWYENVVAEIGEEIVAKRRNRINPRVIRCKRSKWAKKKPEHRRTPQPTKTFRESIEILC